MNAVVRPMTQDDIPALATWLVELPLMQRYGLTVEKAETNFQRGLANGDWLLTADAEMPTCGFAWVIPKGTFGRSPYLRLIGVREDMAGAGIGGLLLQAVERKAAEVAADLFLLVSDFNEGAQRFYQKHGFRQIGAVPGYLLPDVTELMFRKRLK